MSNVKKVIKEGAIQIGSGGSAGKLFSVNSAYFL